MTTKQILPLETATSPSSVEAAPGDDEQAALWLCQLIRCRCYTGAVSDGLTTAKTTAIRTWTVAKRLHHTSSSATNAPHDADSTIDYLQRKPFANITPPAITTTQNNARSSSRADQHSIASSATSNNCNCTSNHSITGLDRMVVIPTATISMKTATIATTTPTADMSTITSVTLAALANVSSSTTTACRPTGADVRAIPSATAAATCHRHCRHRQQHAALIISEMLCCLLQFTAFVLSQLRAPQMCKRIVRLLLAAQQLAALWFLVCCHNRCFITAVAADQSLEQFEVQQQQHQHRHHQHQQSQYLNQLVMYENSTKSTLSDEPETLFFSNTSSILQGLRLAQSYTNNNNAPDNHLTKLYNHSHSYGSRQSAGSHSHIGVINRESLFERSSSSSSSDQNDNGHSKMPDWGGYGSKMLEKAAKLRNYNQATIRTSTSRRHNEADATFDHDSGTDGASFSFSCPACKQLREKAKRDSLESIKMHILHRLQLTHLPNITAPIVVPRNIIENFYKNYKAILATPDVTMATTRATPIVNKPSKIGTADFNAEEQEMQSDQAPSTTQFLFGTPMLDKNAAYIAEPVRRVNNIGLSGDKPFDDGRAIGSDNIADGYSAGIRYEDDKLIEMDEYFSRINSVYIFPTVSHLRHNRKIEVLNFKFDNNHSTISRVTMHMYLHGHEWVRELEPQMLLPTNISSDRELISISIHRTIAPPQPALFQANATANQRDEGVDSSSRAPSTLIYMHTIKLLDWTHRIPTGLGEWVQIEMPALVEYWMGKHNSNVGLVIRRHAPWMRSLLVTGDGGRNKHLATHIEVMTEDKRRHKRSTSLDCQESDHEVRCCRYPLTVNFTNFGWHFVVAPTSFNAYFCNGECKVGYLEQFTHTHIASLTTSATPCCSPTKMSALSLLYFNSEQNLVLSTIPNMSVEKCSCS